MKVLLAISVIILLFMTFALNNCSGSEETVNSATSIVPAPDTTESVQETQTYKSEDIVGNWLWYESSGGFAGIVRTPESTRESRGIIFKANGDVIFYTNDEVIFSSTYTLGTDITVFGSEPVPVVVVDDSLTYIYSFPNVDELELTDNAYDGFMHRYVRDGNEETTDINVTYDFGGGLALYSINTTINSNGIIRDRQDWNREMASFFREGKLSDDGLHNLHKLIVNVMEMDESYLCEDTCDTWDCCPTDMPARQLTISMGDKVKKIIFDSWWNTPDELKEIAETIEGFRRDLGENSMPLE